jgi:preprotein translocase subunit SecA
MSLIEKVFGTHSQHELKRINSQVDAIMALAPVMAEKSDKDLRAMTPAFKERLANGETLDDILVEAFAAVREAARRATDPDYLERERELRQSGLEDEELNEILSQEHTITAGEESNEKGGLYPYRVQVIGGIILHQGRIAEMKTGEGKTLVSTMPAYLNALTGEGVQIVTVNDYLAKRDAEWMGAIHRFMGLKVGVVLNSMSNDERRAAYNCDITYVTNNELGFDYLRDNMVIYKENLVQRGLKYAIIDEVDSVLIDEARTPLIISGDSGKSTKLYELCDLLAKQLIRGKAGIIDEKGQFVERDLNKMDAIMGSEIIETGDFVVNEKEKNVNLTEEGVKKVEQFFHIDNLADAEHLEIQHCVILALRAHNLMFIDQDYVVTDDQVLIVDEFTGRIMPGRRYSDGLHQAIEAKENVKVKRESRTLATITFQNLFNKYEKKSGMTGTALTEEKEFRDIYGMDVVEIPTNKTVIREDLEDAVYQTQKEKYKAVCDAIEEAHKTGQPVLVGTITIENSELIGAMLRKRGIPHEILNAKYHEKEAEIVAKAGVHGAVTIATNMAGRGTDIKLDEEARAAGGLRIIGTERHEARRIDNQLRGRSGRQGDPGVSRFYISLEDDLMRLFGSERLLNLFSALRVPEGEQIEHKMLSNAILRAQEKIEINHFGARKNLLDYDAVMNEQREIIYAERKQVLDGEDMRETIINMLNNFVEKQIDKVISPDTPADEWNIPELNIMLAPVMHIDLSTAPPTEWDVPKLKEFMKEQALKAYEQKEAELTDTTPPIREIERIMLLKSIDSRWMAHIDDMDQLRQGIGLQAYGQRDPKVEYKMLGFEMFGEMTQGIAEDTVKRIFLVRIEQKVEREQVAKVTGTNKDETAVREPKKRKEKKIFPNEKCPCGSGLKYKQCKCKEYHS